MYTHIICMYTCRYIYIYMCMYIYKEGAPTSAFRLNHLALPGRAKLARACKKLSYPPPTPSPPLMVVISALATLQVESQLFGYDVVVCGGGGGGGAGENAGGGGGRAGGGGATEI